MTTPTYGAQSRRPVYSGTRRVAGLYERTWADGSTVYEAALRLGGRVRRHRLEARTKTDAIAELRALQVDYDRGEERRSPAAAVTVAELASDYIAHLRARVGDADPRRRRSPRTIKHYDEQLRLHVLPLFGQRPAAGMTVADMRRLLDTLAAKRLAPRSRSGLLGIVSGLLTLWRAARSRASTTSSATSTDEDRPGARARASRAT